jgi:hypothetical protein
MQWNVGKLGILELACTVRYVIHQRLRTMLPWRT